MFSTMTLSSFNIIVFGETGVGKSSVINLIAGTEVAPTSSNVGGCTLESKQYTFPVKDRTLHIWDTVGLGEPFLSETNYLSAIEKAYILIKQVVDHGGLDLLLFCIPGNSSVTETMICNYRLFSEVLCEKRISIAVVVTRLEDEEVMEKWWGRNQKQLTKRGLKFSRHACITGLPEHPKTPESRVSLERLLLDHGSNGRYIMSSPQKVLGRLGFLIISRPKTEIAKQNQLAQHLRDRCKMDDYNARKLAETLSFHRHTTKPSLNVILFGEAGVGKSSVINLIAGRDVADTSRDARGCTLQFKQYTFEVAKRTFNIWDTMGLGEPTFSVSNYLRAIENTYTLIKRIEKKDGLDLLLFCIRGGRFTASMPYNYRLFFEILCQKKIPIAAVVTHLEDEEEMEGWWSRNEKHLSTDGLKFGGHACVTAKRGHPKAVVGRSALESLLLGFDHTGRYRMPPASAWFSGFLERLSRIPRANELKDKRNDVERTLRRRCNMSAADAQRLSGILTAPTPPVEWQD